MCSIGEEKGAGGGKECRRLMERWFQEYVLRLLLAAAEGRSEEVREVVDRWSVYPQARAVSGIWNVV